MKITNKKNLPAPLLAAAHIDEYSKGEADVSVTELISPPRIRLLRQAFPDQEQLDVEQMLNPILGTAFHKLMEKGEEPGTIKELRLFHEVLGWIVSGQIDRVEWNGKRATIRDYKVSAGRKVTETLERGGEWAWQLNAYGLLFEKTYGTFPKMEIITLIRDYREYEKKFTSPIQVIPIKRIHKFEDILEARVKVFQDAQQGYDEHGTIPRCTDEDRWRGEDKYAKMFNEIDDPEHRFVLESELKSVNQRTARAERIVNEDEYNRMLRMGYKPNMFQLRMAEPRRCEKWCPMAEACDMRDEIIKRRDTLRIMQEIA